jgi:hypothetical protein
LAARGGRPCFGGSMPDTVCGGCGAGGVAGVLAARGGRPRFGGGVPDTVCGGCEAGGSGGCDCDCG